MEKLGTGSISYESCPTWAAPAKRIAGRNYLVSFVLSASCANKKLSSADDIAATDRLGEVIIVLHLAFPCAWSEQRIVHCALLYVLIFACEQKSSLRLCVLTLCRLLRKVNHPKICRRHPSPAKPRKTMLKYKYCPPPKFFLEPLTRHSLLQSSGSNFD